MNVCCDEGVERPIVERLRADGHSVEYIAEFSPGVSDDAVLARAAERAALLITCDKDFGELVYRQRRASNGVVLLRLAGLTNAQKAGLVSETLAAHGERLVGALSVVTAAQVRIRRGP